MTPTLAVVVDGAGTTSAAVRATVASARRSRPVPPQQVLVVSGPPDGWLGLGANTATSWAESTADFLVFVRAGGGLVPEALDQLRRAIVERDDVDLVYVDDSAEAGAGGDRLTGAIHRPGFSPDRLRAQMYLGELVAVRRSVALRLDPDGTALGSPLTHPLALALAERCRAVAHVPRLLYRRSSTPAPPPAGGTDLEGLNRQLAEAGFPGRAVARSAARLDRCPGDAEAPPVVELEPRLQRQPRVSIVIPTVGSTRIRRRPGTAEPEEVTLVVQAAASVLGRSSYDNYEIVVVTTPGTPPDLAGELQDLGRTARQSLRTLHDRRPFNFSNACNRGAVEAVGEILVFLNDDTEVGCSDWLERLVMWAGQPDIGAVGARLLYEDGRVQHAGIWTRGGHPAHRYERFAADHPGYQSALTAPQNCLAVTGACLAVEARKFDAVGGFSPVFPSSYNDVDLCLKLADAGLRTVVDPGAVLTHLEAASRDPSAEDWELAALHERWRNRLNRDPFDNPNHLAPRSDEYPPPDPTLTERNQRAGRVDHAPRIWPALPLRPKGGPPAGASLSPPSRPRPTTPAR